MNIAYNNKIIEKIKSEKKISITLAQLFNMLLYFANANEEGFYEYVDFMGLMNLENNPRPKANVKLSYYLTCGNLFKRITGCTYQELDREYSVNISCNKGDNYGYYNFYFGCKNEDEFSTKLIFSLNGQMIQTGFDNNAFQTVEKANSSLAKAKETIITIYFE